MPRYWIAAIAVGLLFGFLAGLTLDRGPVPTVEVVYEDGSGVMSDGTGFCIPDAKCAQGQIVYDGAR